MEKNATEVCIVNDIGTIELKKLPPQGNGIVIDFKWMFGTLS